MLDKERLWLQRLAEWQRKGIGLQIHGVYVRQSWKQTPSMQNRQGKKFETQLSLPMRNASQSQPEMTKPFAMVRKIEDHVGCFGCMGKSGCWFTKTYLLCSIACKREAFTCRRKSSFQDYWMIEWSCCDWRHWGAFERNYTKKSIFPSNPSEKMKSLVIPRFWALELARCF